MNCTQARRLFGACWDDETTQAEREWLETHFASCAGCRAEYDAYTRVLELASTLPKVEPAPDLVERVLTRARRQTPAADRLAVGRPAWVPVTAAAALVAILGLLVSPWIGLRPERVDLPVAARVEPSQAPVPQVTEPTFREEAAQIASDMMATIPESLFDHNEDVEFILDPVSLRQGRASLTRAPGQSPATQGEHVIISF